MIMVHDKLASQFHLLQERCTEMREPTMQEGWYAGSAEQQHNPRFEPPVVRGSAFFEGEEEAGYYDDSNDDAESNASSEALALAVATEEAAQEDAAPSREGRQGLSRLGSLLPRWADVGQEGGQSACLSMLLVPQLGECHCDGTRAMRRAAACAS